MGHFLFLFCNQKQKCPIFSQVIKDMSSQYELRNSRTRQAFVCVADTTQIFVEISGFNINSLRNHNRYNTCLNWCYYSSILHAGTYQC